MIEIFYHFGIALAIGLLIGLEREAKPEESNDYMFGGIRTFPLLAILGCAAAMLADKSGSVWGLLVPMGIVGALLTVAYVGSVKRGDFGLTTEVAGLLTAILGALCYYGQAEIAVAIAVVMLVLLSSRGRLHRLSKLFSREEIVSLATFGIMTAIILPILPNEPTFPAPFDVLIPRNIWLMVVLVTGIGMVGYFLKKLIKSDKAIVLTGFLGGLVSSTAVTLAFAAKSKARPNLANIFAIAILVAWITMFLRVIVEVFVVNAPLVEGLWIPMLAAAVAGMLYCYYLKLKSDKEEAGYDGEDEEQGDGSRDVPFDLKKSLIFGGLYAAMLIIANLAQTHFGDEGIYISAVAAGFTDVDAITLSMAELSREGGSVAPDVAVKAITLAAVSNTLVKASLVLTAAHKALKKVILPGVILIVVAALASALMI